MELKETTAGNLRIDLLQDIEKFKVEVNNKEYIIQTLREQIQQTSKEQQENQQNQKRSRFEDVQELKRTKNMYEQQISQLQEEKDKQIASLQVEIEQLGRTQELIMQNKNDLEQELNNITANLTLSLKCYKDLEQKMNQQIQDVAIYQNNIKTLQTTINELTQQLQDNKNTVYNSQQKNNEIGRLFTRILTKLNINQGQFNDEDTLIQQIDIHLGGINNLQNEVSNQRMLANKFEDKCVILQTDINQLTGSLQLLDSKYNKAQVVLQELKTQAADQSEELVSQQIKFLSVGSMLKQFANQYPQIKSQIIDMQLDNEIDKVKQALQSKITDCPSNIKTQYPHLFLCATYEFQTQEVDELPLLKNQIKQANNDTANQQQNNDMTGSVLISDYQRGVKKASMNLTSINGENTDIQFENNDQSVANLNTPLKQYQEMATQTDKTHTQVSSTLISHDNLGFIVNTLKQTNTPAQIHQMDQVSQTISIETTPKWTQTIHQPSMATVQKCNVLPQVESKGSINLKDRLSQSKRIENDYIRQLDKQQAQIILMTDNVEALQGVISKQINYITELEQINRQINIEMTKNKQSLLEFEGYYKQQSIDLLKQKDNEILAIQKHSAIEMKNLQLQLEQKNDCYQLLEKDFKEYQESQNQLMDANKQYIAQLEISQEQLNQQIINQKSELEREIQQLLEELQVKQREFNQRPSKAQDIERIYDLEQDCIRMNNIILSNSKQINHANEIVKYLQIELENYKKSYNIFTGKSKSHASQNFENKKQIVLPNKLFDDDLSVCYDPIQPEYHRMSGTTTATKIQASYRATDFGIKKHHNARSFFKNIQSKHNMSILQTPTMRMGQTSRMKSRKFSNPLENDNLLNNASRFVQNLKNTPNRINYSFDKILTIKQNQDESIH